MVYASALQRVILCRWYDGQLSGLIHTKLRVNYAARTENPYSPRVCSQLCGRAEECSNAFEMISNQHHTKMSEIIDFGLDARQFQHLTPRRLEEARASGGIDPLPY